MMTDRGALQVQIWKVQVKISNIPTLAKGDNNTFAVPDIREAFLNLNSLEFLSHPNFPEELPSLPT